MSRSKWNGIIWEGIYDTWEEASKIAKGSGFSSDTWISTASKKLKEYRESCKNTSNPTPVSNRFSSLPLVVSSYIYDYDESVCILDFGGGVGTHYELLKKTTPQCDEIIDYHIIETKETCSTGSSLFDKDDSIEFHSTFPITDLSVDICYSNSVLQYIEDWLEIIESMIKMNPEYIVLDDFPAGDNDEFITIQNYYLSKMPHRFFNLKKSIKDIESLGYNLCYKSRYFGEVLGNFKPWPMNNFDKYHRIDHSSSLVFKKVKK